LTLTKKARGRRQAIRPNKTVGLIRPRKVAQNKASSFAGRYLLDESWTRCFYDDENTFIRQTVETFSNSSFEAVIQDLL
jgi:hypothetical protein